MRGVKVQMRRIFPILLFILGMTLCLSYNTNAQSFNERTGPVVVFETNQGNIEIQLFEDIAPKTCENMVGLINKKYYDGIIFHRVR